MKSSVHQQKMPNKREPFTTAMWYYLNGLCNSANPGYPDSLTHAFRDWRSSVPTVTAASPSKRRTNYPRMKENALS